MILYLVVEEDSVGSVDRMVTKSMFGLLMFEKFKKTNYQSEISLKELVTAKFKTNYLHLLLNAAQSCTMHLLK